MKFFFRFLLTFFLSTVRLIEPLCLGGFVGYFSPADGFNTTLNDAYWYAAGIVFCNAFTVIMYHPFVFYMTKFSCKIRLGCSGLIYQKALRLTKSSIDESQTGKIFNLISNDLYKFGTGVESLHDIWRGPFESAAFFTIIYMEIGMAAVIGMVFLLSFIPCQCKDKNIAPVLLCWHLSEFFFLMIVFFSLNSMDWQENGWISYEKYQSNRLSNKNYGWNCVRHSSN